VHPQTTDSPSNEFQAGRWRGRVARAAVELAIIFLGVSAAFFVEGYRSKMPVPFTERTDAERIRIVYSLKAVADGCVCGYGIPLPSTLTAERRM